MTDVAIPGLGLVNLEEISSFLIEEVHDKTWFIGDFKIKGLYIVGSRIQNKHRRNSDLDVVLMYDSSIKDDRLHDILNMEPSFFEELQIDFISHYGSDFESSGRPYITCIIEEEL